MKFNTELSYLNLISEQNLVYRLTSQGLDLPLVQESFRAIKEQSDWLPTWMGLGSMYEKLGDEALVSEHRVTAGEYFIKAALAYHFAQFLHFADQAGKSAAQAAKIAVHRKAQPLVTPPMHRAEAKFEGATIPILFRFPEGAKGPVPAVVIVCGTDSTKEENYTLERSLLDRGFATVSFDGPGQGEVWPQMKMRPDYHKVVSLVADAAAARPEIDADRLVLLGKSFGGLLAPAAAAHDPRFKACLVNGGYFDTSFYDWSNPLRSIRFQYVVGAETLDDAKRLATEYTLADCIENVRVPLMVIHGGRDRDAPASAAKRIADEASGPATFIEHREGIHCCHNVAYIVTPATADWLSDQVSSGAEKRLQVASG
jgi:2,6-dihydroxypseudooxynicotine hydrolase